MVSALIQVGANFRVQVEDHGRPVKGLRVELRADRSTKNRAVSTTDKNGLAFFHSLRPGSYDVRTDLDAAGISDEAAVQVIPSSPADVTVHLKWPSFSPIVVRSLQGTLRAADYQIGQPQPLLSLDLVEGISGRSLQRVRTTGSGEFSFDAVAPGLYFLKPSGQSGELIAIAVAVDTAAPVERLEVDFGTTSCGLWYIDQSQCPHPELQFGQLAGQVLDVTGAAIPRAAILLFDHSQNIVERLESDTAGNFASHRSLSGTYDLLVSALGFSPFRTAAHTRPSDDSAPPSPLTIQLGPGGSCSSVAPQ